MRCKVFCIIGNDCSTAHVFSETQRRVNGNGVLTTCNTCTICTTLTADKCFLELFLNCPFCINFVLKKCTPKEMSLVPNTKNVRICYFRDFKGKTSLPQKTQPLICSSYPKPSTVCFRCHGIGEQEYSLWNLL